MAEVLHYRGDQRNFDPEWMLGPDMDRRRLVIKSMAYDPATDVSTATLRAVLPDEFREAVKPLVAQQQARSRIRSVFGD